MATLLIPAPLRGTTNGEAEIEVDGAATVRDALRRAAERHEGLASQLFDDAGELRRFVNVFVGEDDVRELGGLSSELRPGDTISIVPAVAGGMS